MSTVCGVQSMTDNTEPITDSFGGQFRLSLILFDSSTDFPGFPAKIASLTPTSTLRSDVKLSPIVLKAVPEYLTQDGSTKFHQNKKIAGFRQFRAQKYSEFSHALTQCTTMTDSLKIPVNNGV